jgi:CRISPR-associated endonuclease Cas2
MYIVAYDISSQKIRTKIARYLEKKGLRIQKSVFSLDVSYKAIIHIKKDLTKLRKDDGVIHIFAICRNCQNKSIVIGKNLPELFFFFD